MINSFSLYDLVDKLGGEVIDDNKVAVTHVGSLQYAESNAISFFNDTKYNGYLSSTKAAAVILKPEHVLLTSKPKIITNNPYAYFAKVSQLLNPKKVNTPGIHPSAIVHPSSNVPVSCHIAENVCIQNNVILGEQVEIGAGSVVESNVILGDKTILESNVTIKSESIIGENCHIFSGAVIGNDGFGYAEESSADNGKRWVKIPQVGRVIIHAHVDIGANTTIDRGAIDDTVIAEGVKIDNLVQIAHNCRIGAHTVIAGCVGIAGSAIIGEHCRLGGGAMILGHLNIVDHVTISPGSMIMRSIQQSGTYTALMPSQEHSAWLKTAANVRQLTQLTDRVKKIEAALNNIENLKKT
jgi:UDP-3-O-[3-hydroxymyristoyl] glucosamine N-acyltransferase